MNARYGLSVLSYPNFALVCDRINCNDEKGMAILTEYAARDDRTAILSRDSALPSPSQ